MQSKIQKQSTQRIFIYFTNRTYKSELNRGSIDAANEVLVTAGALGGLFCAFQAFINPGDQVISIEPYFNLYKTQVEMAGGEFIGIPLQFSPSDPNSSFSSKDFKIDMDLLKSKITEKTKMIIINTPHNPTVSTKPTF